MNNPTKMTDRLDPFEAALLAELRREVAEHPAPAPVPVRRSRRRVRLAAVGATGIAASVVTVFGLGGTGGSPAYAVQQSGDGDVIVTVHRLDDAAGLEDALRAQGIDATVSYDADGFGSTFGIGSDGTTIPDDELPPPPEAGGGQPGPEAGTHAEAEAGGGPTTEVRPGGPAPGDDPCGLGAEPATLVQQGGDWVLMIPADSPLQDRHVEIGTDPNGGLSVVYAGSDEGSMCGLMSVTGP